MEYPVASVDLCDGKCESACKGDWELGATMRLLLVRHGATANNIEERFTGQTDAPLSELGERQAHAVGRRLATTPLAALVSSDLQRARATAEAIANHQPEQPPIQVDADLREIAMGIWEGRLLSDIVAQNPELVVAWRADPERVAPPGGETVAQLHARITRALDRWQAGYPNADQSVVWVTHGGVIGVLICHLLGMDLKRRGQFRRDNTAITEIALEPPYPTLLRLNDTAHFEMLETLGVNTEHAERLQVL